MILNMAIIMLLQFLSTFLRKNNYLRFIIHDQKWELFYGQVINLMAPFILPWTFAMVETGVSNFGTKLSTTCSIFAFFMGLIIPFIYLF